MLQLRPSQRYRLIGHLSLCPICRDHRSATVNLSTAQSTKRDISLDQLPSCSTYRHCQACCKRRGTTRRRDIVNVSTQPPPRCGNDAHQHVDVPHSRFFAFGPTFPSPAEACEERVSSVRIDYETLAVADSKGQQTCPCP